MLQKTFEIQLQKPFTHLLNIEAGEKQLILTSFNEKQQPANSLEYFSFDGTEDWNDIVSAVKQQSSLLQNSFDKIQIIWENAWAQCVPLPLFSASLLEDYNRLSIGSLAGSKDLCCQNDSLAVPFLAERNAYNALNKVFPGAAHTHKYCKISGKLSPNSSGHPLSILLIFYQQHFIITAERDGNLQLINSYPFDNETEVVYHLLNTVKTLNSNIAQTPVTLSGLIDGDSALFREIYKFVPVIDVDKSENALFLRENTGQYPSHFFVPFFKYV